MNFPRRSRFPQKDTGRFIINYHIRASHVFCIDQTEQSLGNIALDDAVKLAKASGLDLVMVSPAKNDVPPVCRILDFGKFKFEQDKKDKAAKKKQKENEVQIKEIKFRPTTNEYDLKVKANQVSEFIQDGNKIKVSIIFRGREMAHKEVGMKTLKEFASMLTDCKFESEPILLGKALSVTFLKK